MNLLFDCHTFDAGPQGTTTFLAGLINALPAVGEERGVPLTIQAAARDRDAISRFVTVPVVFRPMPGGFITRNLVSLPNLSSTPGTQAVISQYVRPFRSKIPTISVIHDVLFLDFPHLFGWRYRFVRKLLFGWAARNSDVIITVSAYSRARIAHHFNLPLDRIEVLPNAVDLRAPSLSTRDARDPSAPVRLLYVSRFETRKRQHWCVAAANCLARQGRHVELTLVGHASGTYADEVCALIRTSATPGVSVEIRSDVSRDDLDALYSQTDLFLFPSECEGFGIPVIEAAAHGVPCVVSANTAMTELADHYTGLSVIGDDRTAFVTAVIEAVDRLTVLKLEARKGAQAVQDTYRWSDVAHRLLDILDRNGIRS